MRLLRTAALLTLLSSGLPATTPVVTAGTDTPPCQFTSPNGSPSAIKHVIHIQFDNVHFRRDNPNVPSDLEQMPHLLNFIEQNGVLLSNEWTPLIAHTGDDLVTGLTGLYGDRQGLPFSNSFEIYNDANPVGSYNTSVFTYWTDTVKQDSISDPHPDTSFQMLDAPSHNLQAPWVPFVNHGCNFGAVSTVNQVLENNTTDIAQVFSSDSPLDVAARGEANTPQGTNDFVGVAVHCTDTTCSTVGNGAGTSAKPEPNGQGSGALFGHKSIVTQVPTITQTDGVAITGFGGFDPSPQYTLGYMLSLLKANVPVVYGYVADAHDSRNSCATTTPSAPLVSDTRDGKPCGAYAPGEAGYVQQLAQWDSGFQQFFTQLAAMGIDQSNTVFVFHSDENDHYAGSAPSNPGCAGVNQNPCVYDRTKLGEVATDLPALLQQQFLYDWGGSNTRGGFNNTDAPYGIDFDTAPGFWIKSHPARTSDTQRKLEKGLAAVNAPNPYTGTTAQLFNFLADQVGMQAEHMVSADDQRTPGIVGFGQEDHFIQTAPLISQVVARNPDGTLKSISYTSGCNTFPSMGDATCTNNGAIWLHGDYAPDIDNTWAAFVGPGVTKAGVDASTFADHADIRPTLMTLVCLKDSYTYEGRAILEDLQDSALPVSITANRQDWTALGQAYKQVNAPLGSFGNAVIGLSTTAIRSDDQKYERIENDIATAASNRDALAQDMQAQLDTIPGCGSPQSPGGDALGRLTTQAMALVDRINQQNESERTPG